MIDDEATSPNLNSESLTIDRELVERGLSILARKPSALVADIDGTISPIASTPAAAVVIPGARVALQTLAGLQEVVAIVTGRTSEDAERMLGIANILYIGNHGLERRWQGETRDHSSAKESLIAIDNALAQVDRDIAFQGLEKGVLLENKRLSASIHFRLSPMRDEIRPRIGSIAAAAATAHGLSMTEGKYVYELRPPLTVNKGTAVLDLIEDRNLNGIIFLGDDVTDVDAFQEIRKATANGLVDGLAIAVKSAEARPIVLEEADATVEGVPGAVALLSAFASRLHESSTGDGVD